MLPTDTAAAATACVPLLPARSLLLCNIHRNTFSVLLPQISSSLSLSPSQAGAIQVRLGGGWGARGVVCGAESAAASVWTPGWQQQGLLWSDKPLAFCAD